MVFQWEEAKSAANEAKHGVGFLQAAQSFRGPILKARDTRRDYGEVRFVALGTFDGEMLCVLFTERDGDIRLDFGTKRQTNMSAKDTEASSVVRNGSLEDLPPAAPLSKTVRAMSNVEIGRRAETDPDLGDLPADFWDRAEVVEPAGTEQITLRLPRRVVGHFKATGKGYQSRISAVLASYVDAVQRKKTG